jgi:hypothetical protein
VSGHTVGTARSIEPSILLRVGLLAVAFAGALCVHFFVGLSFAISFLIFFVGWPLGGTLVTLDDDLPGGWSNPDGSVRPPWLESPFWGQIAGGGALSVFGAALDGGVATWAGLRLCIMALSIGCAAWGMLSRRWWLTSGLIGVLVAALL